MSVFGRKRYQERQESRRDMNHRLGVQYGFALFQMDVPRPAFHPCDDQVEMAFRMGVQAGYTAAEMEFEDEVGWWLREQAAQGLAQLESFLEHPYAAPPAPWPTDDGPLDIHGGDEA